MLEALCEHLLEKPGLYLDEMAVFLWEESGCDKRVGFRRTGWSPLGIAPVQLSQFHRDQRYQILPAYSQDGVVLSRIFNGTTDAVVFEEFIKDLLPRCGKYPAEKLCL